MKKIWIWLDEHAVDLAFHFFVVFYVSGCIWVIVRNFIDRNEKPKPPVERIVEIDSLKIVNEYLEKRIIKIDSIRNEWKEKADSLDDRTAVELFYWLLSE